MYSVNLSKFTIKGSIEKKVTLGLKDKHQILELIMAEYPPHVSFNTVESFDRYLQNLSNQRHYLLYDYKNHVRGWGVTFNADDELWFSMVLDHRIQNFGFGTNLLNFIKEHEPQLSGWVVNFFSDLKFNNNVFRSPLEFYMNQGFVISDETKFINNFTEVVKIKWCK